MPPPIMQTTIQANKKTLRVALHPATVIHANKFSETSGGWGSLPATSTLYTDVVFQSKRSGRHWPIRIEELDLMLYPQQDVIVIAVEETIIGYIDTQRDQYYYTNRAFAREFDLGMRGYIATLLTVAVLILGAWWLPPGYELAAIFPAMAVGVLYFLQRAIWNYRVKKALDAFLSGT